MSTKLQLKKRKSEETIIVSTEQFRAVLKLPKSEAKTQLYDLFKDLIDTNLFVHDKRWLEQIVNFIPADEQGRPKRVPFTEQAKWLKLAERVAKLDAKKEGAFTLTAYQETIIWERLNSDEFTIQGMPAAFVSFILGFLDATGRQFADMEPEKDEDDKKSKKDKKAE